MSYIESFNNSDFFRKIYKYDVRDDFELFAK